jgi:transposase
MSFRCFGVNWIVFIAPSRHPHGSNHQGVPPWSPSGIIGSTGLARLYRIHEPEATTVEGYRLVWYHSARKAELDALTRHKRLERATAALSELQAKLTSPRTRYRDHAKVAQAVDAVLHDSEVADFLVVDIKEQTVETFRQDRRGRPGPETRYVRSETTRFDLTWRIDHDRLTQDALSDGVFPLVSNETTMSALDLLLAYKQQPMIETRFSQLKTDFVVAPVYLKEVSRIQALLCVYFFALLVESLLERELRHAMAREGVESLPLYPEGRVCRRPTARRVIDLFDDVQRHELVTEGRNVVVFITDLTRLQRRILRLLGMSKVYSG